MNQPRALEDLVKKEYHHLDSIYFNTAYFGPSPYSAKQKVSRALQKELDPSFYDYNTWMGISERLRCLVADVLKTSPDAITHSTSSSDIINLVARGFKFNPGDQVVALDREYPSNVLPWMLNQQRRGVDFVLLDLKDQVLPTVEWLAKNLPKKTRIFSISMVAFDTGKKIDLLGIGKLMRERDILFCVDATQALGGMPITPQELALIDVLSCSSYKWMLGPYGHAFGYFSERALELIEHTTANWIVSPNSKVVHSLLDYTIETLPGARKYDRGQASNFLTMACLEAGLEFLLESGLDRIAKHNAELRDHFLAHYPKNKFELITPTESMANILALKSRGIDSLTLERELKFRNIDISVRQGNLRLSFHVFNSKEQVEALIQAIDL
jgi:cysteine desulfurase / selenocysteine lyase